MVTVSAAKSQFVTDHCGPCTAFGLLCVCVCVCSHDNCQATFDLDNRSTLYVIVVCQSSRSHEEKCSFLTVSERVKLGKPDPEMWRKSRPELETLNK